MFGYLTAPGRDSDTQQYLVSSEMSRVDRKQVGFGGNVQDKHLDASASGIQVPTLMHWAPGVPCPMGSVVGATATGLTFLGA